jgi:hypothetical protein
LLDGDEISDDIIKRSALTLASKALGSVCTGFNAKFLKSITNLGAKFLSYLGQLPKQKLTVSLSSLQQHLASVAFDFALESFLDVEWDKSLPELMFGAYLVRVKAKSLLKSLVPCGSSTLSTIIGLTWSNGLNVP